MACKEVQPDSLLRGGVTLTAFDLIANKDCTPFELTEHLKGQKSRKLHSPEDLNLLQEMIQKGRLSLFVVILHLGLWKELSKERVPRSSFSDHSGCTAREMAAKKKTKKPTEELNLYDAWEDSLTQLMIDCRSGDTNKVRTYLQNNTSKTSLNIKDSNQMNALYWAVVSGKKEIVELLLNAGVDPKVKNEKEETLLHVAAMFGKTDLIDLLLNDSRCQFDPYIEDVNAKSAYDRCAENGDEKTLRQFIKAGKKPKDSFLVLTCFNGRQQCAQYCINNLKMNVNGTDTYNRTPILRACEGNRIDLVRFLIGCGADLKAVSSSNRNIFHMIAENGNLELANCIIRALDSTNDVTQMLNQRDRYAGTDLCFLIRGTDKKKDAWHYCEVVRWKCPVFLKKTRAGNVDVVLYGEMIKSGWGVNPSQADMTEIENIFKKRRLDPDAAEDMTPLHIVSFKGNIKLVEKFLEYKAEPNMKDSFGLTPIMLAAAKGEQNIVECLQVAGASLKEISNDNQTLQSIAEFNEQSNIIEYLNSLDIFQLSENFVRANVRKIREELSPEKLDAVRQSGENVKKHIIDTLREFRIDINQYLVDVGSGPIAEATED